MKKSIFILLTFTLFCASLSAQSVQDSLIQRIKTDPVMWEGKGGSWSNTKSQETTNIAGFLVQCPFQKMSDGTDVNFTSSLKIIILRDGKPYPIAVSFKAGDEYTHYADENLGEWRQTSTAGVYRFVYTKGLPEVIVFETISPSGRIQYFIQK